MNYIEKISKLSDRYGDKLIELMDRYGAKNLQEITPEQSKEFYEELITHKERGEIWKLREVEYLN